MGIWPAESDGTDVNAAHRSNGKFWHNELIYSLPL